jgi:hypothetical protein
MLGHLFPASFADHFATFPVEFFRSKACQVLDFHP